MNKIFRIRKKSVRIITIAVSLLICFTGALIFSLTLKMFAAGNERDAGAGEERQYHIVIAGTNDNTAFLQQVYHGAAHVSARYNAVVELQVPASRAEDIPLQSLIDYASYIRADGLIVYVNDEKEVQTDPVTAMGTTIPMVVLGNYSDAVPKISYIGTGYFELGRVLAQEILSLLGESGSIFAIVNYTENNPSYSLLMNGLQEILSAYSGIQFSFYEIKENAEVTADELVMQGIASSRNVDLILCLNHEDTVRAAQSLIELSRNGKTYLVGFHESEKTRDYLQRGVITSLISYNPEKIGEFAMRELFEYKRTGYANEYITTDIMVLKKENVK